MSEFKFACPVCGQHMMCDASQGGSVMDCPTCFQKIVAPQAPAEADQKLILTGTKLETRDNALPAWQRPDVIPAAKKFPLGIILAVLVAGAAGAGVYWFAIKPGTDKNPPPGPAMAATNGPSASTEKVAVAPPASDANWALALGTNAIFDVPVAGRIHGQDFVVERAYFQNSTLTLRAGTHGPLETGVQISFGGAQAETLAGKMLNILADTNKSARVTLRWKDGDGTAQRENFEINYAMRLEFGALANNRLPGKIWLCTPDKEKSYLLGSFNADARKPRPKKK
jgi:hypothetical protein